MPALDTAWFEKHQRALVLLGNTPRGRRLLGVHRRSPARPMVEIGPNYALYLDEYHPTALHALWSLRRPRALPVIGQYSCAPKMSLGLVPYVERMREWQDYLSAVWTPVSPFPKVAFAETGTFNPEAHPETTTADSMVGYVATAGNGDTWANVQGHVGTTATSASSPNQAAIRGDNSSDTWRNLWRTLFTSDTSTITNGISLTKATVTLSGTDKTDANSISPTFNIYTSAPADDANPAAGDYNSFGSTALSGDITYAAWNAAADNVFSLSGTGIAQVSLTGITKLGIREATYDAADVEPTWSDTNWSRVRFNSADAAGTDDDPLLSIWGTATPRLSLALTGVGI